MLLDVTVTGRTVQVRDGVGLGVGAGGRSGRGALELVVDAPVRSALHGESPGVLATGVGRVRICGRISSIRPRPSGRGHRPAFADVDLDIGPGTVVLAGVTVPGGRIVDADLDPRVLSSDGRIVVTGRLALRAWADDPSEPEARVRGGRRLRGNGPSALGG